MRVLLLGLTAVVGCEEKKPGAKAVVESQEGPITDDVDLGSIVLVPNDPELPLIVIGQDQMQVAPNQLVVTEGAPTLAEQEQLRLSVGRRLLSGGDFAGAEVVFRALHAAHPDHPRALFLLGLSIHKQKRYAEARPLLERSDALASALDAGVIATIFPESPHVPHFLGWCTYYLGDVEAAAKYFDAHIAIVPGEFDSQFGRGVVAIDQDDLAVAKERLRAALALLGAAADDAPGGASHPRDRAKVLVRLGDVSLREGDVASARTQYEEAVHLWPAHHEGWAKLARALDRLGEGDAAQHAREQQQRVLEQLGRVAGTGADS